MTGHRSNTSKKESLGLVIREMRKRRAWKLADLSARSGVALSTLSKVENGALSLTFDRLQQVATAFDLSLSEFLSETETTAPKDAGKGRISWAKTGSGTKVDTGAYVYRYLCEDLRAKTVLPVLCVCRARTLQEFGPLLSHEGEEFILVLRGQIAVHTEAYSIGHLSAGEGVYIDSRMGHAYLNAGTEDDALIFSANVQHAADFRQDRAS